MASLNFFFSSIAGFSFWYDFFTDFIKEFVISVFMYLPAPIQASLIVCSDTRVSSSKDYPWTLRYFIQRKPDSGVELSWQRVRTHIAKLKRHLYSGCPELARDLWYVFPWWFFSSAVHQILLLIKMSPKCILSPSLRFSLWKNRTLKRIYQKCWLMKVQKVRQASKETKKWKTVVVRL